VQLILLATSSPKRYRAHIIVPVTPRKIIKGKNKLSPGLINLDAMKTNGGVKVELHDS
jgi:hypothetical protein